MDTITIQDVTVDYDRAATSAVYKQIVAGSPEQCACLDCRNFVLQRVKVHPPEAVEIFRTLGIDFRKESEIWTVAHSYGGWFHFIGKIVSGEEKIVPISPTYKLKFNSHVGLLPKEFGIEIVTQLEFYVDYVPRLIT